MNQLTAPAPNDAPAAGEIPSFDMEQLVHHTQLPHTRLSRRLDRLINGCAALAHWSWFLLMGVILCNVFLRYALGEGHIELEELQWHLYALGWLLGLSFCYVADDHVRVDLLHERLGLRTQAVIELLGILLLLLPFILTVLCYALPFVQYSFTMHEVSMAPGGLPYRWAIKAVLIAGFALLLLGTLSRLSRICALLFGYPHALISDTAEVRDGNQ